jgi:hypothetical protein
MSKHHQPLRQQIPDNVRPADTYQIRRNRAGLRACHEDHRPHEQSERNKGPRFAVKQPGSNSAAIGNPPALS